MAKNTEHRTLNSQLRSSALDIRVSVGLRAPTALYSLQVPKKAVASSWPENNGKTKRIAKAEESREQLQDRTSDIVSDDGRRPPASVDS